MNAAKLTIGWDSSWLSTELSRATPYVRDLCVRMRRDLSRLGMTLDAVATRATAAQNGCITFDDLVVDGTRYPGPAVVVGVKGTQAEHLANGASTTWFSPPRRPYCRLRISSFAQWRSALPVLAAALRNHG